MGRHAAPDAGQQPLRPSPIAARRLAASTMTGAHRRAFAAEMTVPYGAGKPLLAETTCGWGRPTVAGGLAERRTGLRCLGAPAAGRGRHRWEEQAPEVAAALERLAEAPAPQAPPFRPTLASTRLTAQAALTALSAPGDSAEPGPSPRTLAEVRNRLGFRRRKVVQAKPQTTRAETDAIGANMAQQPQRPQPRQASNACAALVKPPGPAVTCPEVAAREAPPGPVTPTGACTRTRFPVGCWMKTVRSGASPLGVLARPALASSRPARPGGPR